MKSRILSRECRHNRGNGTACQFCRFVTQVGKSSQPQKHGLTIEEMDELARQKQEQFVLTAPLSEVCLDFIRYSRPEVVELDLQDVQELTFMASSGEEPCKAA